MNKKKKHKEKSLSWRRRHVAEWLEKHRKDLHIVRAYRTYFRTDTDTAVAELEALGFPVTPLLLEQADRDEKAEEQSRQEVQRRREEKKEAARLRAAYPCCTDACAFFPRGEREGVRWEELGIDPALSLEEKIRVLAQMDTPPEDIRGEEEERHEAYRQAVIRVRKEDFRVCSLKTGRQLPRGAVWFAARMGEKNVLVCRKKDIPKGIPVPKWRWCVLSIQSPSAAVRSALAARICSMFASVDAEAFAVTGPGAAYVLLSAEGRWAAEMLRDEGLQVEDEGAGEEDRHRRRHGRL